MSKKLGELGTDNDKTLHESRSTTDSAQDNINKKLLTLRLNKEVVAHDSKMTKLDQKKIEDFKPKKYEKPLARASSTAPAVKTPAPKTTLPVGTTEPKRQEKIGIVVKAPPTGIKSSSVQSLPNKKVIAFSDQIPIPASPTPTPQPGLDKDPAPSPIASESTYLRKNTERRKTILRANQELKRRTNDTLLDALMHGLDEVDYVTVIPADEIGILEVELKQWNVNRRALKVLLTLALVLAVTIIGVQLYLSTTFYSHRTRIFQNTTVRHIPTTFMLHTDCMLIGVVICGGLAIVTFRVFPTLQKQTVICMHLGLALVIYSMFFCGIISVLTLHWEVTGGSEHFYSLHSWVGLMVFFLLVWEAITGLYIYFRPLSPVVKYHSVAGVMLFMISGACSISGLLVRGLLFANGPESLVQIQLTNGNGIMILVYCCLIRFIASDFRFRRRAKPEWDIIYTRSQTSLEDTNIDKEGWTFQHYIRRNIVPTSGRRKQSTLGSKLPFIQ